MKRNLLALSALLLLLAACGDASSKRSAAQQETATAEPGVTSGEEKTGSFTADGKMFTGAVSTQYFNDHKSGPFSVLCQQDEPFALLQITFSSEKDALNNASLKPGDNFTHPDAGDVHVALTGIGEKEFTTEAGASKGSISVSGRTVHLRDLQLFNRDKQSTTVTADISF